MEKSKRLSILGGVLAVTGALLFMLPALAGAHGGAVHDVYNVADLEVFNVNHYGANDYTLIIHAGTYDLGIDPGYYNHLYVVGNNNIVKSAGDGPVIIKGSDRMVVDLANSVSSTVEGLTIQAASGQVGIAVNGTTNCIIRNNEITVAGTAWNNAAIELGGGSTNDNVTIEGNDLSAYYAGIASQWSTGMTDSLIKDNIITGTEGAGMVLVYVSDTVVEGNDIITVASNAFATAATTNMTYRGNHSTLGSATAQHLSANGSGYLKVTGNTMDGAFAGMGVSVTGAGSGAIAGNAIDNANIGVYVHPNPGSSVWEVSGNLITNGDSGIVCDSLANVTVSNNVIYNAGIAIAAYVPVTIDRNTILSKVPNAYQTYVRGITAEGSTVTNNILFGVGNPQWGIRVGLDGISAYNDVYGYAENWPAPGNIGKGVGDISVDPVFSSVNPSDPDFLYLLCSGTPDAVLFGAEDGLWMGVFAYGIPCVEALVQGYEAQILGLQGQLDAVASNLESKGYNVVDPNTAVSINAAIDNLYGDLDSAKNLLDAIYAAVGSGTNALNVVAKINQLKSDLAAAQAQIVTLSAQVASAIEGLDKIRTLIATPFGKRSNPGYVSNLGDYIVAPVVNQIIDDLLEPFGQINNQRNK